MPNARGYGPAVGESAPAPVIAVAIVVVGSVPSVVVVPTVVATAVVAVGVSGCVASKGGARSPP